MDVLGKIKNNHQDAVVMSCKEERQGKLKVRMEGIKHYVILKGELIRQRKSKICDCLIFIKEGKNIKVALVERKRRNPEIDKHKAKQLKEGYEIIKDALPHYGINSMKDINIEFVMYYEYLGRPSGAKGTKGTTIYGKPVHFLNYHREPLKTVFD